MKVLHSIKTNYSGFKQVWILASFGTIVIFVTITYSFLFVDWSDNLDYKTIHYGIKKCNNCNEAKQMALDDFKKNNKKWFAGGFRERMNTDKLPYNFYSKLETDQNIKVIFYGCVGDFRYKCYNKTIDSLTSVSQGNKYLENMYISMKKVQN